jgi:hypothetical protein
MSVNIEEDSVKLPDLVSAQMKPTNYLKEEEDTRIRERYARLDFAHVLTSQVLEKKEQKKQEQRDEEYRIQLHIQGDYFRPQQVHRFKKMKEHSSGKPSTAFYDDPISGKAMPYTQMPRRETNARNNQFCFDKWALPSNDFFNTLPLGMNHVVPRPSQRFPRLATDVVYRATRRNYIQASASAQGFENGIPGGASRGKRGSESDLQPGNKLEKLMTMDWNRYDLKLLISRYY